jgi:hypothetical protein
MRGRVSGFILLVLGAGLGLLGVMQLGGVFSPGYAAPAVLGALIAFVPASVFAGLGADALRRSFNADFSVGGLAAAEADDEPRQAVVIPFPGRRPARF